LLREFLLGTNNALHFVVQGGSASTFPHRSNTASSSWTGSSPGQHETHKNVSVRDPPLATPASQHPSRLHCSTNHAFYLSPPASVISSLASSHSCCLRFKAHRVEENAQLTVSTYALTLIICMTYCLTGHRLYCRAQGDTLKTLITFVRRRWPSWTLSLRLSPRRAGRIYPRGLEASPQACAFPRTHTPAT